MNQRARAATSGAVLRHHSARLTGSIRRGTWPVRRNHSSGERRPTVSIATSSPRASAVIRQGPRGVPSALTGKTSRPDELNEIATGGSFRTVDVAATSDSAERKASRDSVTSISE